MTRFNIKNNGRKFVVFAESKEHAVTKLRDSLRDAVSKIDRYKNVDIWKDEAGNLYADFTIRHSGKRLADLKTKDINEAKRVIERQISFLMDETTVSRWIKKNGTVESAIIRHGNGYTFYSAIIKEDKDFGSLDEAEQYAKSLGYTKKQRENDADPDNLRARAYTYSSINSQPWFIEFVKKAVKNSDRVGSNRIRVYFGSEKDAKDAISKLDKRNISHVGILENTSDKTFAVDVFYNFRELRPSRASKSKDVIIDEDIEDSLYNVYDIEYLNAKSVAEHWKTYAKTEEEAIKNFESKFARMGLSNTSILNIVQTNKIKDSTEEDYTNSTYTNGEYTLKILNKVKPGEYGVNNAYNIEWNGNKQKLGADGISMVIRHNKMHKISDSAINDTEYAILHPTRYEFLSIGGRSWVKEDSNIIQRFISEDAAKLFGDRYVRGQYRIVKFEDSNTITDAEIPHITKEQWNKIPKDYKHVDPKTGKKMAFAGSLGIAPGGTTLLTEGKHFIIDADIEDVKELVTDIMKNDQIRISRYSSNGEITLDSNQLYSTDVEELARVIRQRGHKCDILNTRTVKLRDINSLKDSIALDIVSEIKKYFPNVQISTRVRKFNSSEGIIKEWSIDINNAKELGKGFEKFIQNLKNKYRSSNKAQINIGTNGLYIIAMADSSIKDSDENNLMDSNLEVGKTYTSKSGNKLIVKKLISGFSDYNGEPYVDIYYDFETTDGKKGSSKCNTNDFFRMLKDSSINDYDYIGNAMIMNKLPKVGDMANKYNFGYSDSVIVDIKKTGNKNGHSIYTIYCVDKEDLDRYKKGFGNSYHYTAAIKDKSVFSKETMNSVQEGIEKDYASMRKRISQMKDELEKLNSGYSEIEDDRLSPMTYVKLKELGYSSDDWEGWTQEYANKVVEKSGKDVSEKEKTDVDRYQEYRNSLSKEELEKQAKDPDSKLGKLAEKADIRAGKIKNNELEKASKNFKRERVKENYNTLKNNTFDIDSVFLDKNKLKKLGINYSEDEEQNMYAVQDKLIELSGYKKEDFDSEGEIYSGGLLGIIAGGDELKDFSYMNKNKLDNLMSAAITIRKILDE